MRATMISTHNVAIHQRVHKKAFTSLLNADWMNHLKFSDEHDPEMLQVHIRSCHLLCFQTIPRCHLALNINAINAWGTSGQYLKTRIPSKKLLQIKAHSGLIWMELWLIHHLTTFSVKLQAMKIQIQFFRSRHSTNLSILLNFTLFIIEVLHLLKPIFFQLIQPVSAGFL